MKRILFMTAVVLACLASVSQGAVTNVWTENLNGATIGTYDGANVAIPGSVFEHREPLTDGSTAEIVDIGAPQNRVYRVTGATAPDGINALVTQNGISTNTWSSYGTIGIKARVNFAATGTATNNYVRMSLVPAIATTGLYGVGWDLDADTDNGFGFRVLVWVNEGTNPAAGHIVADAASDATIAANKTYEVTTTFKDNGAGGIDYTYQVANITDSVNLVAPASGTITASIPGSQSVVFFYGRTTQIFNGWVDDIVLDNTPSGPPAAVEGWQLVK